MNLAKLAAIGFLALAMESSVASAQTQQITTSQNDDGSVSIFILSDQPAIVTLNGVTIIDQRVYVQVEPTAEPVPTPEPTPTPERTAPNPSGAPRTAPNPSGAPRTAPDPGVTPKGNGLPAEAPKPKTDNP